MQKMVAGVLIIFSLFMSRGITAYGIKGQQDEVEIIIDIVERKLTLMQNGKITKEYPIAVGKSHTQTPIGKFIVQDKIKNRPYYKKNIPGGAPNNPLGSRWIQFKPSYGIHGNNNPNSIGKFISGGCIRMFERDVQELYNIVEYNDSIYVKYEPIEVKYDVDGESPILTVYPDYYNRKKNIDLQVDNKLIEIDKYDKIHRDKLSTLKKVSKKNKTVFSDSWTFFVNDRYITDDVIIKNNRCFINKEKVMKYFNIKVYSIEGTQYCEFLDEEVLEIEVKNKKYLSLENMANIIGGDYEINYTDKSISYSLNNYLLFNNSLIKGVFIKNGENTRVPLMSIINLVDIDIKIIDSKLEFYFHNAKIDYINIEGVPYVDLKYLSEKSNLSFEEYTIDKHIEIIKAPKLIYKDEVYSTKIFNNEVYVSYNFLNNYLGNNIIPVNSFENKYINKKYIDNIKYFKLKDLKDIMNIERNEYSTIITIKDK
ncbi:L,D-transpeptidase [Dethiothermospora halolimnae]|uniref:L,D-transpeptidase n=1 Tax=Dethiothermospora halolimnae TaxID=3114390 RepID=UPI003CCBFCE4